MINLRNILLQTKRVSEVIKDCISVLISSIYEAISDPSLDSLLEDINSVIDKDISSQKTELGMRNLRCNAVVSENNGLLEVARKTYKEANDDVTELVDGYSGS